MDCYSRTVLEFPRVLSVCHCFVADISCWQQNNLIFYWLGSGTERPATKVWPHILNYPQAVVWLPGECHWRLPSWAWHSGLSQRHGQSGTALRLEVRPKSESDLWVLCQSREGQPFKQGVAWHPKLTRARLSWPELRDGMLFLFDQKRILKSDSCLHTTRMPSTSVRLTHEGLTGRKGEGKNTIPVKESLISMAFTPFEYIFVTVHTSDNTARLAALWETELCSAVSCRRQCIIPF